jgi:glycine/D-amino acid oxidase-like deaminating enzyme
MHRRAFLKAGGSAALGVAIGGCAGQASPVTLPRAAARRRALNLAPAEVSMGRIIRTTVGLRPHRDSGFVLRAERFDDRTLIHNYGHGGAGMSLSWGTGVLVADLALAHTERRAAVIGCGIVGLTCARQLQRRGFDVTIYAMSVPPDTTSNMAWAGFTPVSGLVSNDRRTPEWDDQFRRAIAIAYREHQLLVGSHYGVSWINEYALSRTAPSANRGGAEAPAATGPSAEPLLPNAMETGQVVLGPGEHPFATAYAVQRPLMRFEPSIYLDALMHDVVAFGGRIVIRAFDTPRDLMSVPEPVIVNCTGLGAKKLFGDEELVPIKGQLTVLVPQPEVTYSVAGMMPRSDGIALGHTTQRGIWTLDVDEEAQKRVIERQIALFSAMRAPAAGVPFSRPELPAGAPDVASFLARES